MLDQDDNLCVCFIRFILYGSLLRCLAVVYTVLQPNVVLCAGIGFRIGTTKGTLSSSVLLCFLIVGAIHLNELMELPMQHDSGALAAVLTSELIPAS
jgi:hypothetical protein